MIVQTRHTQNLGELSQRTYTPEGYMLVSARIARIGPMDFEVSELFEEGDIPEEYLGADVISVNQSAKELFRKKTIESARNKAVTVDHPEFFLTLDNTKEYSVGHASDVYADGEFLSANLVITDQAGITAIESGQNMLSIGVLSNLIILDSPDYQGEFTDMVINHIALTDNPRGGSQLLVSNSKGKTVKHEIKLSKDLVIETEDEDFAKKSNSYMVELKESIDKLEAELAVSVKNAQELSEALKAATAVSVIDGRIELVNSAKSLNPDLDATGLEAPAIRRLAVANSFGDLAGKSDEYVEALFDAALLQKQNQEKHELELKNAIEKPASKACEIYKELEQKNKNLFILNK